MARYSITASLYTNWCYGDRFYANSEYQLIKLIASNKELITFLGGLSIAILVALQTFLKPLENADKHRTTSATYEKLRHRIEYLLEFFASLDRPEERIQEISKDWAELDSLNVSERNLNRGKVRVKSFDKYPEELGFLDTMGHKQ